VQVYKNIDGDSGIVGYKLGDGYIIVKFKQGKHQHYHYRSTEIGSANLAIMHKLALQGDGLNAFINTNPQVKRNYFEKY